MTSKGKKRGANSVETAPDRRNAKVAKKTQSQDDWPEYFVALFKTYKALNTVIAFCSSRKSLATTFPVVRTSVENITKRPLELSRVSEIKALLPDIIRFAYIPADDHRINEQDPSSSRGKSYRDGSPDIYAPKSKTSDGEEHVLVMEFAENTSNSNIKKNLIGMTVPNALTPQALKNMIEKRNSRFMMAVNELLDACQTTGEDPVQMLQRAGMEHIPVNPSAPKPILSTSQALADAEKNGPNSVPSAVSRPSIESIIQEIEVQESYRSQILFQRVFDARDARWAELDRELPESLSQALLDARNVKGFYTHQAQAINAYWKEKNVIVSTATASGKSIIYQVPALCELMQDSSATALFIYPTKALAQDQKGALIQLIARIPSISHLQVETYDGDTPQDRRSEIRDTASIIFTNFDMIHVSMLPHEDRWRRFLKNLKMVVVDELHYYSGLMGSHVALVMRRFRRVCAAVGNRRVKFISCSATISNPEKHMRSIFGVEDVEVVTDDGSPAGRKDFLVWQPPLLDDMAPELGRIRSLLEGTALFIFLMKQGIRTIVFCKIRRTCELFMKAVRADLLAQGRSDVASKVRAYRGGYSQEDRRAIEADAFSGNLMGIVATNALELGVDIGSLDAVISLGFPFSVASFRQQSGRAGRRSRDSLSVLISDSLPVDKHFVANPDEIFDKPTEDLLVDLENVVILEGHLQCAANEMPIHPIEDEQYFGSLLGKLCRQLDQDKDGWFHTHTKYLPQPSKHVAIRGAREDKYTIIDVTNVDKLGGRARILEEIELSRALFEAYEGGVFMHQGLTFVVKEVSHDERIAKIIRSDVNWTTRPRDFTNIDATQTYRIREIRSSPHLAYFGRVDISTIVFGFFKLRHNVILDVVDLETPPFERDSTGMWVDIPRSILELLFRKGMNPAEGIHSAQHAMLSLTPLYSMATSHDIRTECKVPEKEERLTESKRKRPGRLIFYDSAGKGGGICAKAFDHMSDLLEQALAVIESCECVEDDGCSSCIKMTSCKQGNVVASKLGAKIILQGVLGRPVSLDDIPDDPLLTQTVVPASVVRALGEISVETDSRAGPQI